MNLFDYNRIMIIGSNGSGKSYFARELAAVTGLPLTHLDAEFWRPNWEMPTQAEWTACAATAAQWNCVLKLRNWRSF